MSTGSIIVIAVLMVFASLDSLVDATTTILTASPTVTPSSSSTQSVTPTTASTSTVTSVAPPEAPRKKTCGSISYVLATAWNESQHTEQVFVQNFESKEQDLFEKGVFNDSSKYKDVKVSNLKIENNEGKVKVTYKLCLVLKKIDAGYIEDTIKTGLKHEKKEIKDFEFKVDGVSFKDWKAKAGECSKCSDGGAGPFVIEGTCVPKADYSCNGLKNTDESKDCLKYCDSSAGIMMPSFILAMGIFLSFSFNIWK